MAGYYYVNKRAQLNGDHEVHINDGSCPVPAAVHNRHNLGWHQTCYTAVAEAKKLYPTANGCKFCSEECHTS